MATNLTVSATFTKLSGQPATGLTLSDINLFLTSQNKSTGADTTIWDGTQVATVEINNVGIYTRILATADLTVNDYFAMAQYIGATVLDSNYAYGQVSAAEVDANALLDQADTVETGLTIRGAFRLMASALAGVLSGAATANVLIRNAVANSKTRINATVDADGNRSVVNTDVS